MVLSYIPCNIINFSNLFNDYKNLRKLNANEINNLFWSLLDNGFCKFIITKGKYKGKLCMKPIKEQFINDGHCYCRTHRYQEIKCKVFECNNKRRKGTDVCTKHYKRLKNVNYDIKEDDEIKLFNNIELYTSTIEYPKMDDFYYIEQNIYNIKIKNSYTLPKSFYTHSSLYEQYSNKPIIKYIPFSINKYLYNIYNKFKDLINIFIKKYKINIVFLYYLLTFIKKVNEKIYVNGLYNDHYIYAKDIIKIEYNMLNNYYYSCLNIHDVKIKDINIVRPLIPKMICYNTLRQTPEERKQKKKIQKFNIKYNKLKQINEEYYEWINKNLKTDFFKDKIKDIIDEQMKYLDKSIKDNGKNIDFIRNTYRTIYSYLCNSWEFIIIDNELERHDFKIVYNSDTWKKYGVHENEEYKRVFKI